MGANGAERVHERLSGEQVGPDERDPLGEARKILGVSLGAPAADPEHLVPVSEEKLCEEDSVLAADAGYERPTVVALHGAQSTEVRRCSRWDANRDHRGSTR